MQLRRALGLCLAVVALALASRPATAQQQQHQQQRVGEGPALLFADEVRYDQTLDTVIARGNVEITQGVRTLLAEAVTYNQRTDTMTASGDVVLLEPDGTTVFADFVELRDEMKDGIVRQIRMRLEDDSRIAAERGVRQGGRRTTLTRAVYSPCDLCKDDPTRAPLWQLKAREVVHDQQAREIRYRDASLEVVGIPVAYTPYLSHPDPSVYRRSGILAPGFGSSSNVGMFVQIPYFWDISPDKDATIAPIYTRDEGLVYAGEYRQRFNNGTFEISGSLAEADRRIGDDTVVDVREDEIRGHLFSRGRFDIDDTWRTGFDIQRASDRSYLRRFDFFGSPGNALVSNAFAEGFRGRNYAAANAFLYQDLRLGQQPNAPVVLPILDYNHVGLPDDFGGRFSLDTNFRSLYRGDGADTQRVSFKGGYEVGHTTDFGLLTTVTATIRTDLYYVDDQFDPVTGQPPDNGFAGRVFPQVGIDWRYPFVREMGGYRQVVEPVATVVLSPNGSNPDKIPVEDSVVVELDETNLLSHDRFPGIDRVESGQRFVYGVNFGIFGNQDGRTTAFIGQSYRLHRDRDFERQFGIEGHLSDFVGRVEVSPNPYINLLYRFRADADDLAANRNEVNFSVGPAALNVSGAYIFIANDNIVDGLGEREELDLTVQTRYDDYWTLVFRHRRDLTADGGTLLNGLTLTYEDECFAFAALAERRFTEGADFAASDKILFRVTFKHLGVVETAVK